MMPYLLPVSCTHGGCNRTSVTGTSLCAEHTAAKREERKTSDRFRNKTDKTRKYEMSSVWRTVRDAVINKNLICQAVIDGKQCTHLSEVVHHLISPDVNWELRQTWSNLVAVCKQHHSNSPGDSGEYRYVPTNDFTEGISFPHDVPLSYLAVNGKPEKLAMIGDGTGAKVGTTTAVGDDALDAALNRSDDDWK